MDEPFALLSELAGLTGPDLEQSLTEESTARAVQSLAYILRDLVPTSAGAGASLINPLGRWESSGATDPVVLEADQLQYDLGQGPCLSVWAEQRPIIIQDIFAEGRWPEWTYAVSQLPLRSVLSAPLTVEGQRLGALKVYSPIPTVFDDRSVFLIERLALAAAVLLGNAREREATRRLGSQLAEALGNRNMISRAEGILIERLRLTSHEALTAMITTSRTEDKPLHQVARNIVEAATGQ